MDLMTEWLEMGAFLLLATGAIILKLKFTFYRGKQDVAFPLFYETCFELFPKGRLDGADQEIPVFRTSVEQFECSFSCYTFLQPTLSLEIAVPPVGDFTCKGSLKTSAFLSREQEPCFTLKARRPELLALEKQNNFLQAIHRLSALGEVQLTGSKKNFCLTLKTPSVSAPKIRLFAREALAVFQCYAQTVHRYATAWQLAPISTGWSLEDLFGNVAEEEALPMQSLAHQPSPRPSPPRQLSPDFPPGEQTPPPDAFSDATDGLDARGLATERELESFDDLLARLRREVER